MIFLDFILDIVGYTTTRLLLPTLTFQKVKVDVLSSDEACFNWLGFKRLPNGALLCDADSAGWIGAFLADRPRRGFSQLDASGTVRRSP
ncbi:hypothetical protein [Bradyrhizobium sp. sBnM-33]|uniref:hypothetical protein n=1 Tax=Bradyrhizobium sp. sBnM-33 TaxID=2831780 RepID=UPI001BCEAC72|nr:hypothetical protein [Bradyrhizobium sp. sBnM-33]WOH53637.1 hypothetical protein RX328_17050 [Bradyrhizobium sp. sBnM-33]